MPNPYLTQQADQIAGNLNRNWQENLMPSINSGAMMAGGFGGSRQGVAQGIGLGRTQQAIGDAQTNLYSNAYNTDQQLQAQRDMQANALAAQQAMASQQNQTARDLGFGNLGLGYTQAANQYGLGLGNLGLGYTQAQNSYTLGQQAANTNQYQAQTARDLGYGNLGVQQQQTANNYSLGLGNLGIQNKSLDNNFYTTNRGLDAQQSIAAMQDATTRYGMNNQYQLGLGGLGLQDKSLDYNNANTNRSLDLSQYSLGANLMNQGNQGLTNQGTQLYQSGLTQQQQPWATLGQYAGTLSPFTGLNQSQSQTTPGPSAIQNLLAGGLTGAQIWQLLSGGK